MKDFGIDIVFQILLKNTVKWDEICLVDVVYVEVPTVTHHDLW